MISRCTSPKNYGYRFYGGRGIKVCESWRDFESFYAHMGDRPEGTTLDRVNSDGDYEPGNCRWAIRETQSNNTRSNRKLSLNGETLTIAQWARRSGISWTTISGRLSTGWPVEMALTKRPSRRQKHFPAGQASL